MFEEFERQSKATGRLAMGGQIVDTSLVAALRQHNTVAGKAQIKAGRKAVQKDTDAHRTVKIGRPRDPGAESLLPELAIVVFGCIRNWAIASAASTLASIARSPKANPYWSIRLR